MPPRILVPVDLSESSEAALRWAIDFARMSGAPIEVLHVVHEPNPMYQNKTDGGLLRTLERAAEDAVEAFVGRICGEHPTVEVRSRTVVGTAAGRIIEAVETGDYGHVVMGAHGISHLGERLLGSKAERVAQLCRVPVTIVRA